MVSSRVAPVPHAPWLDAADLSWLLTLARTAVASAAAHHACPEPDGGRLPGAVLAPAAAFVTLHEHGDLRGCMGQLDWDRPMWANVMAAGTMVARADPRFRPVSSSELPALRVEVSVLGPAVELPGPADFDVRAHGIIVEGLGRRALLLPQVAEELGWDAETTLDAVCHKAGLSGSAWRYEGTRLLAFRAVRASEPGFAG